jgi:hypothetical protein
MELTSTRWMLGVALLTGLALLLWWSVGEAPRERGVVADARSSSEAGSARPPSEGVGSGIRPLLADPATPPLEWAREEVTVTLPEVVPPLHTLVTDEESLDELMDILEWALSVGQDGDAGLAMARCAARFEPRLESRCVWEMHAVVHRRTEDTGELVYAKAVATTGAEQSACRAFASCWSEAWAGRGPVPMPQRVGDELAFSELGRSSMWDPSKGVDAVAYYWGLAEHEQRRIDELQAAALGPTGVTASSLGWNMLFARHQLDEAKCMVGMLEGREEACGT